MKLKKYIIILFLSAFPLILGACSGRTMTASGWPSLSADDTKAYLSFNNHVYAVNLDTGTEAWRFPTQPDSKITFYAAPTISDDGQLIIGGYNGVVYSLDPQTGAKNWIFEKSEGRYIGSALITEKGIFAPSSDNFLYALTLDGKELWPPYETTKPIWSSPISDENCDCIYVPSMDHHLYIIDANSGNLIWKSDDLGGAIVGKPAISDEKILYVGTFGKEMYAIDVSNKQTMWKFGTSNWIWSGPTIEGDRIYFGDLSGNFYSIDRKSGSQIWQIQPGEAIVGEPLVLNGQIIFTTVDGKIVSVNDEGAIKWSQQIDGDLYAGPIYSNGTILVANNKSDALLMAYDENGNQRWIFTPEEKK
ncbi:MAG: PQQ-binding-like beta-propeller repeat protein [Anaerolineales bacterium]|nr:PQQ-binding-like beta-propeller repeat protein [Anaerolineales bacterium]